MSYRIEEKIPLTPSDAVMTLNELLSRGAKRLYPKRYISSLYFDTLDQKTFIDSEEGVLPRKKIRIRSYPLNNNQNKNFEVKISSIEGKFKSVNKISSIEMKKKVSLGHLDNLYGLIFPLVEISYNRKYFILNDIRITLDTNIRYTKVTKSKLVYKENCHTIEIKAKYDSNLDLINNIIPIPRRRFSKYSQSINALFR